MSSSSSYATVTYTSMSSDDDVPSWDQAPLSPAHAPVYSEYLALSDDDLEPPVEDDPKEDPEEDPKEEPSEEEELSALADSPPVGLYIDLPSKVEGDEVSSTPPSPTSHQHIIPLSQTGLCTDYGFMTALEEVNKRVTDLSTSHRHDSEEFHVRHQDTQDDRAILQARVSSLERHRRYHCTMAIVAEHEAIMVPDESYNVEKYTGGLPDSIQGSNVARAYAARPGEKREYDIK
ncbi:hypothetical protein Tco_0320312 [Tanacetum coccineum]